MGIKVLLLFKYACCHDHVLIVQILTHVLILFIDHYTQSGVSHWFSDWFLKTVPAEVWTHLNHVMQIPVSQLRQVNTARSVTRVWTSTPRSSSSRLRAAGPRAAAGPRRKRPCPRERCSGLGSRSGEGEAAHQASTWGRCKYAKSLRLHSKHTQRQVTHTEPVTPRLSRAAAAHVPGCFPRGLRWVEFPQEARTQAPPVGPQSLARDPLASDQLIALASDLSAPLRRSTNTPWINNHINNNNSDASVRGVRPEPDMLTLAPAPLRLQSDVSVDAHSSVC